jgi:hypothetical protein
VGHISLTTKFLSNLIHSDVSHEEGNWRKKSAIQNMDTKESIEEVGIA